MVLICGEYNIRLEALSSSDLGVFKEVFLAKVRCLSLELHDLGTPKATALERGRFLRSQGFGVTSRHTATRWNFNTGKFPAERD